MPISFAFYRYRFHFRAVDQVHLPQGKSANVVRGAFGSVLRDAVPRAIYARLFEPGAALGHAPSGLADWPRPFVLRAAHLDGLTIQPGDPFFLDAHVFDLHRPALEHFRAALILLTEKGLGPGRGRARLECTQQLDLGGRVLAMWDSTDHPSLAGQGPVTVAAPTGVPLDPEPAAVDRVTVRFEAPTELKSDGDLVARPAFPALFRRLRDRISTLRSLYGAGPLEVDFRGLGERSAAIRMTRCDLAWEQVHRKSGRTGQVHSIGGFTGEADYEGVLAEFLPWLRAARWVGVGRQTVWGKGDLRVVEPAGGFRGATPPSRL